MARRSETDIYRDLQAAIAAKSIRNVIYKELSQEAGRVWDKERSCAYRPWGPIDGPRYPDDPVGAQAAFERELPYSILHIGGYVKKHKPHVEKWDWLKLRVELCEQFLFLSNALIAAKPFIVKGRAPSEPKPPPASSGTCQCCGRIIGDSIGTIAHHGYTRPRYGVQTRSCYGATFPSFEISRDRLGWMIAYVIVPNLEAKSAYRAKLDEPGVKVPGPREPKLNAEGKQVYLNGRAVMNAVVIGPDAPDYARYLRIEQGLTDRDIRGLDAELMAQQQRYHSWKPGPQKEAPALQHFVNATP